MNDRLDDERTDEGLLADEGMTDREATVVRHEEELRVERQLVDAGAVRARKLLETYSVEEVVAVEIEHADVERTGANDEDSGQIETLPDGSISVPIFEEEVIVTKRTVVRERVVVRKDIVSERHSVETELLREQVEIETDTDRGVEEVAW